LLKFFGIGSYLKPEWKIKGHNIATGINAHSLPAIPSMLIVAGQGNYNNDEPGI